MKLDFLKKSFKNLLFIYYPIIILNFIYPLPPKRPLTFPHLTLLTLYK